MPFRLRTLSVFLSLLFLTLSACTRTRPLPSNADGILGYNPKFFYLTKSATLAEVLETEGPGKTAKLSTVQDKVITNVVNLAASAVRFSADQLVVTVEGTDGLFESSPVNLESVVSGAAALPPATVDTYCLNVSEAGYSEFDVVAQAGQFTFVGVTPTARDLIGGGALISKAEDTRYVTYAKPGFGTLQIDKQSPASEPYFFHATILSAPAPWPLATGMVCRLNIAPVTVTAPTHTLFYIGNANLDGDLGGLAGADQLCNIAAQNGLMTKDIKVGTWRAFLSSTTTPVNTRISFAAGSLVKNTRGDVVVSAANTLFSFNTIENPIKYDQNGTQSLALDGVFTSGDDPNDCNGWTSADPGLTGGTGLPNRTDSGWFSGTNSTCDGFKHSLYCINSNH